MASSAAKAKVDNIHMKKEQLFIRDCSERDNHIELSEQEYTSYFHLEGHHRGEWKILRRYYF